MAPSAGSEKQHTLLSNRSIFQSARYATRVRRTRLGSRYNRAGVCALSRMHASNWAEVQIISQWLMKELPSAPFEIWRYVILKSFLLCAKGIRIINMFRINPPAGFVLLWRVVRSKEDIGLFSCWIIYLSLYMYLQIATLLDMTFSDLIYRV